MMPSRILSTASSATVYATHIIFYGNNVSARESNMAIATIVISAITLLFFIAGILYVCVKKGR